MNQIRRILAFGVPFLWPYRVRFFAAIFLALLFGISNGAFVIATKTLFERLTPQPPITAPGETAPAPRGFSEKFQERLTRSLEPVLPRVGQPLHWTQAVGVVFFLPALLLLRSGASYLSSYCMTWVSARVVRDMQTRVLEKFHSLSLDYFNRSSLGDLTAHIGGDPRRIFDAMNNGLSDLIKEPITLVSILTGMFVVNAKLALAGFVIVPLVILPILLVGNRLKRIARQSIAVDISQGSGLIEALNGIRLIKAYGLEQFQLERYRRESMALAHLEVKKTQAGKLVNPLIEFVSTLGLGALILVVFVTHQPVASFVGFLTGMMMLPSPIKRLAQMHVDLVSAAVSCGRLEKLLALQPSIREPSAPVPLAKLTSAIQLVGVSLDYGHEHVLTDLHLNISKGRKLGLAGPSGSGKTSLIHLLMRFYNPSSGRILWDERDFATIRSGDLRSQIALVSQDVVLFDASVAENIALGRLGATEAEIESAARQAFAHDFIRELPRGYATRVGERGVLLSGGQKARISLARAFLRNAPILILDEPTAALDSTAETEIQKSVDSLEEGRTVVCIAHRLSTLANMDEIIVLESGRLTERGTYSELLAQGGLFSRMASQQGIF